MNEKQKERFIKVVNHNLDVIYRNPKIRRMIELRKKREEDIKLAKARRYLYYQLVRFTTVVNNLKIKKIQEEGNYGQKLIKG